MSSEARENSKQSTRELYNKLKKKMKRNSSLSQENLLNLNEDYYGYMKSRDSDSPPSRRPIILNEYARTAKAASKLENDISGLSLHQ